VEKTLKELALALEAELIGDGSAIIRGVKGIDEAGEGDLTFIANPKYRKKIASTLATAVLVGPGWEKSRAGLLVVKDPYAALIKALNIFHPAVRPRPGISPHARIEPDAEISKTATIYPNAYVGGSARIEDGCVLYPGVYVGSRAVIGEFSTLYPHVTVYDGCTVGKRVILHAGAVIGSDGFGFADFARTNLKVPQVGTVRIEDDVEIGANTTIDRGALGETRIGRNVKIDNLVQIAHGVTIGENSVIVAQVGISGSTRLGKSVVLGGQVGIVGHIEIGDGVMVAARSGVARSIPPGRIVAGAPHLPHREWLRVQALVPKLPEMRDKLKDLLKRVEELEKKQAQDVRR